ncbi:MAG: hypothetical protein ACI85O_000944 [Saprospiraceae bacterium]
MEDSSKNDYIYLINQKEDMSNNRDLEGFEEEVEGIAYKMRTNHLLIIAIDDYQNGIQDLNNAVRDAEAVKEILWELYQFTPENTKVLTNQNATRHNIISAFEGFIEKLTPDDNFIFYFSGHGDMYKPTKRGFWIPADGKPRSRSSWLSNNDIRDFMEFMEAHHVFGIVDSCFSGALFRKNIQENTNTLMYLDSYPSRWLLTAGRETIVPDGVPGTHSPFAKTLISQLSYNPNDALAVSKLCSDVIMSPAIDKVNAKPRGSALPLSSSQGGEFIFYKKGYTPKGGKNRDTSSTSRGADTSQVDNTSTPAPMAPVSSVITNANLNEHLKKLVRLGDTEKAFELLEKKINPESRIANDLTLVQARYNRLVREKRNGLITDEYFSMSNARITHSLLGTIDNVKDDDLL